MQLLEETDVHLFNTNYVHSLSKINFYCLTIVHWLWSSCIQI